MLRNSCQLCELVSLSLMKIHMSILIEIERKKTSPLDKCPLGQNLLGQTSLRQLSLHPKNVILSSSCSLIVYHLSLTSKKVISALSLKCIESVLGPFQIYIYKALCPCVCLFVCPTSVSLCVCVCVCRHTD